jgi:antitoxin PrlF
MGTPDDKHEPRQRTSVRVRLRQKAQLTLPEEVRHVLRVGEGDEVEFTVEGNGRVTVRGHISIPADQAWFFIPERLAGKRQADDEIAADSRHDDCRTNGVGVSGGPDVRYATAAWIAGTLIGRRWLA